MIAGTTAGPGIPLFLRRVGIGVVTMALLLVTNLVGRSAANHNEDLHSSNMRLVANVRSKPIQEPGGQLAFWRDVAVVAGLRHETFRLLDISDSHRPSVLGRFICGRGDDVSIWGRLVFVSVEIAQETPGCDANAGSPTGSLWEGIRIVSIRDPARPEQIATVTTDCGSHAATLVPDLGHEDANGASDPRVLLYVSSYPLPTYGPGVNCIPGTHSKISVVEVPLKSPGKARVVATPSVAPAIGCHDLTVFMQLELAAAACLTESQIWDISNPLEPRVVSRIYNPAITLHHATAFSADGKALVLGDEYLGGSGDACSDLHDAPAGAVWFYDISDPSLPVPRGYFKIPRQEPTERCTSQYFNVVPLRSNRDILVSSWRFGGTNVVDFTDPANPEEIGYYKPRSGGNSHAYSAYWYNGYIYVNNTFLGANATHLGRGMDVLAIRGLPSSIPLGHLNPQTQEPLK